MPNNPNLFVNLLILNDDEIKCTFTPLVQMDQIPDVAEGCNIWPFLSLKAQLKHHFYPMLKTFDFTGNLKICMADLITMKSLIEWIKDKSGHPTAVQFFINRRKTVREEAGLIYYNSGVFQAVPNETIFHDLPDAEYHEMGNLYWKLWANLPWETPRSSKDNFIKIIEPSPIKQGIKRSSFRLTKAENDFLSACIIPMDWANTSAVTDSSLPEVKVPDEDAVIGEWHDLIQERHQLRFKEVRLPFLKWNCNVLDEMDEKIDIICTEIQKLDCSQDNRISKNSKVKKFENGLKTEAIKILRQLKELQAEKTFFNNDAKENEKLFNEFYLPQLHFVLVKQFRQGQKVVEIENKETQYEEIDNMVDWSGQWSSDNE